MSLSYSDVKTYVSAGLEALGYGDTSPMPLLDPGPPALPSVFKKTPNSMVVTTVGNGIGLTLEQTYDQVFITVRILGNQNDYDSAETLASQVDRLLLALNGNGTVGETKVLYIARTGGAPQLVDFDASNRYHFQATYICTAATGL